MAVSFAVRCALPAQTGAGLACSSSTCSVSDVVSGAGEAAVALSVGGVVQVEALPGVDGFAPDAADTDARCFELGERGLAGCGVSCSVPALGGAGFGSGEAHRSAGWWQRASRS